MGQIIDNNYYNPIVNTKMLQMQHFATYCVFSYIFHIYLVSKPSFCQFRLFKKSLAKTSFTGSRPLYSRQNANKNKTEV